MSRARITRARVLTALVLVGTLAVFQLVQHYAGNRVVDKVGASTLIVGLWLWRPITPADGWWRLCMAATAVGMVVTL